MRAVVNALAPWDDAAGVRKLTHVAVQAQRPRKQRGSDIVLIIGTFLILAGMVIIQIAIYSAWKALYRHQGGQSGRRVC